jgi:hypothetical protein
LGEPAGSPYRQCFQFLIFKKLPISQQIRSSGPKTLEVESCKLLVINILQMRFQVLDVHPLPTPEK